MKHSPATTADPKLKTPPIAVILAAGEGSRLMKIRNGVPKPSLKLLGLSLAERTITTFKAAGIHRFLVVLGHEADQVRSHYQEIGSRRDCEIEFVIAKDWELGNGTSALASAQKLDSTPFLLTMSDHLIAPSLIERILMVPPDEGEISLAVDRNKAGIFDIEDVTKVTTSENRVVRIGKSLEEWDAGDTGVFFCTDSLFSALRRVQEQKKHSLTDGVRDLADAGMVHAVDVTGEDWIDVDTPDAYREARRRMLASLTKGNEDGYISQRLNRPLSTRLSAYLSTTWITPNQITVISFLIALVGAGLLSAGMVISGIIGGFLIQAASVIDGCDGEVARLKRLSSPRGAWLDTVLDRYADMAVALAVTFAYAAANPGSLPWIIGFLAAFGFILASYVTKEFGIRTGQPYPNDIFNRLKRRDLRVFIIFLGAVVARPFEALAIMGALTHFCVIGVLVRGWKINDSPS